LNIISTLSEINSKISEYRAATGICLNYTSVKNILIQSWRYKTLAVIKRHKKHLA